MRPKIIGIMGPGEYASAEDEMLAYELGKKIAENGFVLLTGGRNTGVMEAASRGANEKNGIVIGILPGDNKNNMSEYVTIPIITGIGNARNIINILSSDIVIGIGEGAGTFSEIFFAIKCGKDVILTNQRNELMNVTKSLQNSISIVNDSDEIINRIKELVY